MRIKMLFLVSFLFTASILLVSSIIKINVVQTSPETIVRMEPDTVSANVNETFTVNIAVVDVQNLYGLDITLSWNSTVLRPLEVNVRLGQTDGALYNPLYIAENSTQADRYVLAATSTAPASSFNGTGDIVRITFNATNIGNCTLALSETQLWDYPPSDRDPRISFPIEHLAVDGYFDNIIPEFLSYITLIILVFSTLLVILYKVGKKNLHRARHSILENSH